MSSNRNQMPKPSNEVKVEEKRATKEPVKPVLNVIATRPGFYAQMRISEGEKFTIKKFEDVGQWMKFEDATLEKRRVEHFKNKKMKARAGR